MSIWAGHNMEGGRADGHVVWTERRGGAQALEGFSVEVALAEACFVERDLKLGDSADLRRPRARERGQLHLGREQLDEPRRRAWNLVGEDLSPRKGVSTTSVITEKVATAPVEVVKVAER
eukprot:CAMPEP_0183378386 /NCGR_PEP_ID=MMETSP0164_2-20130417/124887_1 /TAXON_ID=221442 /ORGANISM="Coccolithus pelagicus ssp braarudi, Strain PLY182g" /LENGTH=119 /DNA_ID=CAMNT_0025555941 /DNA_START=431 /DNA_END=790 /DNA_ORIENTATION=-